MKVTTRGKWSIHWYCVLFADSGKKQNKKQQTFYKYPLKWFAFSFIVKCSRISQTKEFFDEL